MGSVKEESVEGAGTMGSICWAGIVRGVRVVQEGRGVSGYEVYRGEYGRSGEERAGRRDVG